jgi:hypothetical protein
VPQLINAQDQTSKKDEQKRFSNEELDARLSNGQKRKIRLSNAFHEVAFALADDLAVHPWKFLFYATPIPPFASTIMLIGTLAYIAFGPTKRMNQYRKDIWHSLRGDVHYDRLRPFISEDKPSRTDPSKLSIAWGKFSSNQWYQSRRYLLGHAVEWTNTTRDNWLNRQFRRTLIWDIERMQKGSHGHLFTDLPDLTAPIKKQDIKAP